MISKLPTLPFLWSGILGIILLGIIGFISVATYVPPDMSAFTLTYYNSCATPTRTPSPLPPNWPTPSPRPTIDRSTPNVGNYPISTPFVQLRFPPDDATLPHLRTVHFSAEKTSERSEVVFSDHFQRYFIQQCIARICPLSHELEDGSYEWYVRICEGNQCWRISEIWQFSVQADE